MGVITGYVWNKPPPPPTAEPEPMPPALPTSDVLILKTLISPNCALGVLAVAGLAFAAWLNIPNGFQYMFAPLSDGLFYIYDGQRDTNMVFRKATTEIFSALKRQAHLLANYVLPQDWKPVGTLSLPFSPWVLVFFPVLISEML
jgi:hypothetical protein